MLKKCFTICVMFVCFCAAAGVPQAFAKDTAEAKTSAAEKVRRKVLARGIGVKARVAVKLRDGSKVKGYVEDAGAEHFVVMRTDERIGQSLKVAYGDVVAFKARGQGLSKTSKVLIGVGAGVGATMGVLGYMVWKFGRVNR